jgi:Alpha amylase, catalytic domain
MRLRSERGTGLRPALLSTSRRLQHACVAVFATLALASCATETTRPDQAGAPSAPVKVVPQRNWSDAVLYFVILDRFADGSGAGNLNVDRSNPGGFHGGDFVGLTRELDEIAALGATAIWITPVVRQIDFCPSSSPP